MWRTIRISFITIRGARLSSPIRAEMPGSLAAVVVGPATAAEINWLR